MLEMEAKRTVVAASRAWIGTSYHHAADVEGVDVDCAMLRRAASSAMRAMTSSIT